MKWEYLREEEFEGAIEKCGGLCVLPMGCLEKHGQHLPVGTDSLKAMALAEQAAEIEEVMVFPTGLWLGEVCGFHANPNPGANKQRGGIAINPQTLFTVLEELCVEIARNGFRKILFLDSHGGNTALLDQFVRTMYYKPRDFAVMETKVTDAKITRPENMYPTVLARRDEFAYLTDEDMEALRKFSETGTGGGHADWKETALIYAYYPKLVAADKFDAEDGLSTHRADHLQKLGINCGRFWPSNYPNAYNGYSPFGCSHNIGKAMAQLSVERLVEMFKVLKADEECVRMAKRLPPLK